MPASLSADRFWGEFFTRYPALVGAKVCVGLSGGLDSATLLALCIDEHCQFGAVRACHINHQLNPQSEQWANHCRQLGARLGTTFSCITVDVAAGNLEAEARQARYAALAAELAADEWLVTAHHADDQLETMLLALMRGAGLTGISGMQVVGARETTAGTLQQLRPLLQVDRAQLQTFAEAHGLSWIDDPSNADTQYDRNFLRHEIVPKLRQRWPQLGAAVSHSSARLQDARRMTYSLASDDLHTVLLAHDVLSTATLLSLARERQHNLLRHWCEKNRLQPPAASGIDRFIADISRGDEPVKWDWPGHERDGGVLYRHADKLYLGRKAQTALNPTDSSQSTIVLGQERVTLENQLAAVVEMRSASGGEHIVLGEQSRPLKDLFYDARVLPIMRRSMPLLYVDDVLINVGNIWLTAAAKQWMREGKLKLHWQPSMRVFAL